FSVPYHAFSQSTEATIVGKITDGAEPLSGTTITIRNESTGFTQKTVTNQNGNYSFQQLPLGAPYTVTANHLGFQEQKQTDFRLNYGDELNVNFQLTNESNTIDEIVVQGQGLQNKIRSLGASTAITANELKNMPVNGRNFSSLIDLSPMSTGTNLAGQRASSTNFTVDGMNSRSTVAGGNSGGAYSISMEAIREFKVVTNDYDVTYGRSGGGSVTTV